MLKEVLSEFDEIVSPYFINENMNTFRNLVQGDLEILSELTSIFEKEIK